MAVLLSIFQYMFLILTIVYILVSMSFCQIVVLTDNWALHVFVGICDKRLYAIRRYQACL